MRLIYLDNGNEPPSARAPAPARAAPGGVGALWDILFDDSSLRDEPYLINVYNYIVGQGTVLVLQAYFDTSINNLT
ncbi:hypothetical protein EVAR_28359_1 [Eumeta japonica]|uniref:Uncharacterized protein n=1 Tax=Eumeta variegata TaxID=151549 RepID=A0A4C1V8Z1_EUMVA|nr:hypothetical protein EVAR_28359_1 [Eumeta japonica]